MHIIFFLYFWIKKLSKASKIIGSTSKYFMLFWQKMQAGEKFVSNKVMKKSHWKQIWNSFYFGLASVEQHKRHQKPFENNNENIWKRGMQKTHPEAMRLAELWACTFANHMWTFGKLQNKREIGMWILKRDPANWNLISRSRYRVWSLSHTIQQYYSFLSLYFYVPG